MNLIDKLKNNKLIKSSLIYSLCILLIKGINFITFPIFSRMLSTSDFGVATMYATWIGFITIFGSFQLNACIATARIDFDENKYKKLLSTITAFITITFSVLLIISILFKDTLSGYMDIDSNFVVLMTVQSFFGAITAIYTTNLMQQKKDKQYLKLSLYTTITNIIVSMILVMLMKESRYIGKILGGAIATVVFGTIFYFKLIGRKFYIDKECLSYAMKLSLPIIPHVLSHQLLSKVGTLILNETHGSESVGVYNFAFNIGLMIQMLWTGVNSAWVPWLFDHLKADKEKDIVKASKVYIAFFTVLTMGIILTIPEIAYILAPKEYWEGIYIIPLIVLSYYIVFLYSFPVNLEFYYKNTKYIPIGTVGSAIINIILSLIFVPRYGLLAAASATLISYVALFIFHYIVVTKFMQQKDVNTKYYLIGIVVVCATMLGFYLVQDQILVRYGLIVVMGLGIVIFRNKIVEAFK
ncbi:MAG: oligosaccharide flippase family protein [Clostridiales bacterium]|nr:oligosaccharide flippase family protein [Clostridiales bacterium]